MKDITITLGLPTYGTMHHPAIESLIAAVGSGHIQTVNLMPRLPIHQARTRIVEQCKTSHLLFVDDDMVYTPRDIVLLKAIAQAGGEVVAGLCYSRTTKAERPVVWRWYEQHKKFALIKESEFDIENPGVVEGAHVAFTLINMEVFDKIGRYFIFGKDSYFGEDVEFMHRLRKANILTVLEPRARIGHLTYKIL